MSTLCQSNKNNDDDNNNSNNNNGTRQSISIMGEHSFEVLAWAIVYIEDSVCPSRVIFTLFQSQGHARVMDLA